MKNKLKISTILMIVLGSLIIIGYTYLFVQIILNIDEWKMINAKVASLNYQLNSSYNNKYVFVKGQFTFDEVSDESFNVAVKYNDTLGLARIVEKYVDNEWIVMNEGYNASPYYTKIFFANNVKLGVYSVNKDFAKRIIDRYNERIDLESTNIDLSKVKVPNGYKVVNKLGYSNYRITKFDGNYQLKIFPFADSIKYITNSQDMNNPKSGDIRIYYGKIDTLNPYYVGVGLINNNNVLLYSEPLYSNENEIRYSLWYIDIIVHEVKIMFVAASIILLIGFMLLLFGLSRLNFIESKFGKIKKYKIVLTSIILGIIMPLILILLR